MPSDGDIVSFLLQVAEEDLLPLRFQSGSHVLEQSELGHVVAGRVTEEREPLDMVADLVTGIRVHKAAQWAAVDDEPWDEGSELRRGVDVHFPHSCCMRRPWGLKDAVDFQLGEFSADAFVQLVCVLLLFRVINVEVDVNFERRMRSILDDGIRKFSVSLAQYSRRHWL